jgi:hypothetical protein
MPDNSPRIDADFYVFPEDEEFLTTHQVAKIRNTTVGALATERWREMGPPYTKPRDGGGIRYPKSLLLAYLSQGLVGLDRLTTLPKCTSAPPDTQCPEGGA